MLVGKYVRLRILESRDAEYMRLLRNSPEISKQFQSRHFISDSQQKTFVDSLTSFGKHMYFVAETLMDTSPFGFYFVRNIDHRNRRGENGVFLDPNRTITGVEAFEAAYLLMNYEFSYLNFHKICADVLSSNTRAIRFNEGIGMSCEGVLKSHVYYENEYHDLLQYSIFCDEFKKSPTPIIHSFQNN